MYKILTSTSCGKCTMIKGFLKNKGIKFEEVPAHTDEGKELIKKFNIVSAGTVINTETNEIVDPFKL